jgi:hypothetical protein
MRYTAYILYKDYILLQCVSINELFIRIQLESLRSIEKMKREINQKWGKKWNGFEYIHWSDIEIRKKTKFFTSSSLKYMVLRVWF